MELLVQKREKLGKQTKALKREGLVAAELYGHGVANLHLAVKAKDFMKVLRQAGESSLVDLIIDGQKRPALIHDFSADPVTDEIVSIDFHQVRLDEKVKIKVPIHFMGVSEAVKAGGVLVKAMSEIEVETLPTNIPASLEADLAKLATVGQSIYVRDLNLPSGVKIFAAAETPVATVVARVTEEQEAAMAQTAADVSTVKVETEEKKAEREAEKAATTPEAKEAPKTE